MQSLSLQALFYKYEKKKPKNILVTSYFVRKKILTLTHFYPWKKKNFIIWILQACPLCVMMHF